MNMDLGDSDKGFRVGEKDRVGGSERECGQEDSMRVNGLDGGVAMSVTGKGRWCGRGRCR